MNKSLYIFDLDDTLIYTSAVVKLINQLGEVVVELGSGAYNDAREVKSDELLNEHITLDFSEFDDGQILREEQCTRYLSDFTEALQNPNIDVYISTARQNKEIIQEWVLDKTGVFLEESFIHTCNPSLTHTIAEDKAIFLEDLAKTGKYREVFIYEDADKYIDGYKKSLNKLLSQGTIEDAEIHQLKKSADNTIKM